MKKMFITLVCVCALVSYYLSTQSERSLTTFSHTIYKTNENYSMEHVTTVKPTNGQIMQAHNGTKKKAAPTLVKVSEYSSNRTLQPLDTVKPTNGQIMQAHTGTEKKAAPTLVKVSEYSSNRTLQPLDTVKPTNGQIMQAHTGTEKKAAPTLVKVSEYSSNRTLQPLDTIARSNKDDGQKTQLEQTKRYLFPLMYYACGPCEQYSFFVSGIINAMSMNRSLVTIPFHNNHLQNVFTQRNFNETFDYAKLRQIVELSTVDEFIDTCGTNFTAENILLGPQGYPNRTDLRDKALMTYHGYVYRLGFYIPSLHLPTKEDVQNYQESLSQNSLEVSKNVKCIIFVTDLRDYFRVNEPTYRDIIKRIRKHLIRASYIQKLATDAIKQISGGLPYAALHWRNRSAEYCSNKMTANQLRSQCGDKLREEIAIVTAASGEIANAVATRLKQMNITKLYIAAPDYENEFINVMKKTLPGTKEAIDITLPEKYKNDNYVYSLVDQEIAQRSTYFIKSSSSVWSTFVDFFRVANNSTIILSQLPGYPESVKKLGVWMK